MHAYTVTDNNGMHICGNSDDGVMDNGPHLLADQMAKGSRVQYPPGCLKASCWP